jgi:hypothetical protein
MKNLINKNIVIACLTLISGSQAFASPTTDTFMSRQLEGIKNQYQLIYTGIRSGEITSETSEFFKSQAYELLKSAIGTCNAMKGSRKDTCSANANKVIQQIQSEVASGQLDTEAGGAMINAIQSLQGNGVERNR